MCVSKPATPKNKPKTLTEKRKEGEGAVRVHVSRVEVEGERMCIVRVSV